MEQVEQVEPVDLVEQVEPVNPVDPVEQVEPVDPVDPVDPVEQVEPVDPVDLVEQVELVGVTVARRCWRPGGGTCEEHEGGPADLPGRRRPGCHGYRRSRLRAQEAHGGFPRREQQVQVRRVRHTRFSQCCCLVLRSASVAMLRQLACYVS